MDKKKVKDYDEDTEEPVEGEELAEVTLNEAEAEGSDEIGELREQVEEADNKYKRALADYQNLQKRVADEKRDWIKLSNRDLLLRILTVLDTLLLAQQHVADKNLAVSIQQFLDVLKAEGVTKIDTLGKEFDPHLMEAVSAGTGAEGKVIQEVRAGFLLHESLLRAAQVIVGKED